MKLGDKEIKTGLEVGRDVHAFSVTEKIEERIRQEIIEKYGKILSSFEIQQITGREKERQEKRKDSLERSRVKILKMKDRAILIQDVRRAVQEGTLFKQRVKSKREIIEPKEKEETEKPTETIQPTAEQFSEEEIPPEQREESQPEEQQPTTPAEGEQKPSEESSSEEPQEETEEEEKKDEPQSKPNIKPRDFDY